MKKNRSSKPKVKKDKYTVINPFVLGSKAYNRGDTVRLAKATADYYKTLKKI